MKYTAFYIAAWFMLLSVSVQASEPVKKKRIPAGTAILIETNQSLNTDYSLEGNQFSATLAEDLRFRGKVYAHAGTPVKGYIIESRRAGRLSKKARMTLELTEIMINGRWQEIETDHFRLEGRKSRTGAKVGGGAVIGAILGGGKGARNGALIGLGVAAATKGKQIDLPAGTMIEFYLSEPVEVRRGWF